MAIIADNEINADGNIVLSKAGTTAVIAAARRLLSTRKPRVNLKDPAIMREYKARLIAELDDNLLQIGAGGELISEYELSDKIGLGANTIHNNPILHAVYERYRQTVCNAKPATVDNG